MKGAGPPPEENEVRKGQAVLRHVLGASRWASVKPWAEEIVIAASSGQD